MSASSVVTIQCDHAFNSWQKCGERAQFPGGPTITLARKFTSDVGWVMIKGRDYCPKHADLHPTHGTVEQELLANSHFKCVGCGKIHGSFTGRVCPCGEPFPNIVRQETYR